MTLYVLDWWIVLLLGDALLTDFHVRFVGARLSQCLYCAETQYGVLLRYLSYTTVSLRAPWTCLYLFRLAFRLSLCKPDFTLLITPKTMPHLEICGAFLDDFDLKHRPCVDCGKYTRNYCDSANPPMPPN